MQPLISVITVNYNSPEVTCDLIESVLKASYKKVEIIVVDNASEVDPGSNLKQRYPQIKYLRSEKNLGFAGGNNLGIQASKGDFLFFLNNDVELTDGAIDSLLALFERFPRAGIASPKICYYNAKPGSEPDVIQYVGSTPVHPFTARNSTIGEGEADLGQYKKTMSTGYAHGTAVMVPRNVVEKVGPMPDNYFLFYEVMDWCEKIKNAGFEVYVEPQAKVYHKESYTVDRFRALKIHYETRSLIQFMHRNQTWSNLVFFWFFMVLSYIPNHVLTFLLKGEFKAVKALFRGLVRKACTPKEFRPVSTPLTLITWRRQLDY